MAGNAINFVLGVVLVFQMVYYRNARKADRDRIGVVILVSFVFTIETIQTGMCFSVQHCT